MWSTLQPLADVFYPRLCLACSRNLHQHERDLCWQCLHRLPRTHYHRMPDNPLERLFWGRTQVRAVTSLLFFTKNGITQNLLHRLKYSGQQEVGVKLGNLLGRELQQEERFKSSSLVIPVPLHPKKMQLRGYNQSALLARGMAESLRLPVAERLLQRSQFTESQTRKGRFERWENVAEAFYCPQPELLAGKVVLLVDDVLTTGATLEACARPLQSAGAVVLMATLACSLR